MSASAYRHPDWPGLLAAVCAAPDDDSVRLIVADWLDEHSCPERAEFIRVQIRIANFRPPVRGEECTGVSASWCPNCGDCTCRDREERMDDAGCPLHAPESSHDVSLDDLRDRERELKHPQDLTWHLRWEIAPGHWHYPAQTFRRGFVAEVTLSWPDAAAYLDAVLATAPVTEVTLTTGPDWQVQPDGNVRLGGREKRHWIPRGERYDHSRHSVAQMLLAAEWPRITAENWHLPATPHPSQAVGPRLLRS